MEETNTLAYYGILKYRPRYISFEIVHGLRSKAKVLRTLSVVEKKFGNIFPIWGEFSG